MSYTVMENVINSINSIYFIFFFISSVSKKVGGDFLIPFKT